MLQLTNNRNRIASTTHRSEAKQYHLADIVIQSSLIVSPLVRKRSPMCMKYRSLDTLHHRTKTITQLILPADPIK